MLTEAEILLTFPVTLQTCLLTNFFPLAFGVKISEASFWASFSI